jgi:glycosyltransferase involved in cell wall biosynthesis
LAPSLFEGFGMPPIEAMFFGVPLLSTHETCSFEVSNGIAEYVDDARNPMEWADMLDKGVKIPDPGKVDELKEKYSKENTAKTYNHVIKSIEL